MGFEPNIFKSSSVIWLLLLVIVMVRSTKGNENLSIVPKDATFQSNRIHFIHKALLSTRGQVLNDKKMQKVENKTKLAINSHQQRYRLENSLLNTSVANGSCDAADIFEDILILGVRTANFTFGIITDGALIVADFSICITQFNPYGLIKCIYKLFQTLPNQIRAIIEGTKYFIQTVKELVPEIYHKIKSCYGHKVADYLNNLNVAVGQVATCAKLKLLQE